MSERLMKEMMVRLSLDMDDFRKSMNNVQEQVRRSMEKVENQFESTSDELDELGKDFKKFQKKTDDAFDKMADSAKQNSREMSNAIKGGFGKIISASKKVGSAIAVAFSVRAVVGFGKAVVESASDLYALEAQFGQVMKGMEDEANKAVERMSKEFGMLPNRLKGDLSAFTSQFKGLGLSDTESLKEAENALTLSADAAAFFDMTVEEATDHVRSFIKGNYVGGESVQLFGSETMIATWASKNMGSELKKLGGKWKNLDEKSKQYFRMRYAEAMYKEAGVTGQAHREMDMYANVMGNATQAWKDFKAQLGSKLLDKTTDAFKTLSSLISKISESKALEQISELFAGFGSFVFEGAIKGIKGIAKWIESVDWWLVGEQLGTIWGYLKDFVSGAWDSISEALEPIGEFLGDIFDALSGDVNTEGMDGINQFLVTVKPMFKWLAENGEKLGEIVTDLGKAWATWNVISLGFEIGSTLKGAIKTIQQVGFNKWLVTKILKVKDTSALGSLILKGLTSGAGSTLTAITIPLVLALSYEYWGSDEDKKAFAENLDRRFGADVGGENTKASGKTYKTERGSKTVGGAEKTIKLDDGTYKNVYDWEEFKLDDKLKELWAGCDWKQMFKDLFDGIKKGWDAVSSPFKKIVGAVLGFTSGSDKNSQNRGKNTGNDLFGGDTFDWDSTKFTKGLKQFAEGLDWNEFFTAIGDALKKCWDAFSSPFKSLLGFLLGLDGGDSKQNRGKNTGKGLFDGANFDWEPMKQKLDEFLNGISTSWSTWGEDIKENWNSIKEECGKFWDGICNSSFVTGVQQFCADVKVSWTTWGTDIKANWNSLKEECGKFWDGICDSKFGQGVKNFFNGIIDIYNAGVSGILGLCNLLIDGVNAIYKGLTGKKKGLIERFNPENSHVGKLAKGTDNWRGGTALVGEAGRELVSDPKLGTFMADRPMLLPLSQGAMVLRNSKTEKLLNAMGIKAFAKGTNEGFWDGLLGKIEDIWNYMSNPKELWEKLLDKLGFGSVSENPVISAMSTGIRTLFSGDTFVNAISKIFEESIPDASGISSVNGWRPLILKAASFFGEKLTENEILRVLQQIKNESGGNQTIRQSSAVQDINAKTGNWARGLLQYVPSTFNAYKVSGFGNINNGFHQLLAFFNNSTWRKALPQLGVKRGWSPRGSRRKAKNGILVNGATPLTVGEAGQEAVVPLSNARALKPFGQSVMNALKEEVASGGEGAVYEFNIPVIVDGREIARATATFTKEELDKMEKRNNRLNGRK